MKTLLLSSAILVSFLNAQNLKTSVKEVLSTNPIILERLKNYNATKEDIATAKSGYYPKLDLSLGGGTEFSQGTDANGVDKYKDKEDSFVVYQNSLTYTHNLFKGFETSYQVEQQEHRTLSSAYSYIEKANDISFKMVDAYLQVMKNQELLKTAQANVDIDEEIFSKVQKLFDSGLTTLSEVNKIESSLALAKSNLVVQENTIMDVSYNMQGVLGRYLDPNKMNKPDLNVSLPSTLAEATEFAIKNNPSLLVSNYNIKLAQATYKEKKSPFYPSLDIEVSQSMNKNLSAIEGTDDRFRAMAYLKYNLFNGFSDSAALQKSISTIHQEIESKNQLRREVIEGLNLSWAAYTKLSEQLKHLKKYKDFSLKTLTLYSKEYDLGRRSLLDLLSAQNDFIGSKAQIINTEYSILFAKYRILDAMGILVQTIMKDNKIIYDNVGLGSIEVQTQDKLPIRYDRDNDLIVNEDDLCDNSLSSEMHNIYGCKYNDDSITRIERYDGFLFDDDELTSDGEERMLNLITQLKSYNWKFLKFDILANAQDKDMTKKELYELSLKRAEIIKIKLINAGADKNSIKLHSKADNSPMFSDSVKLNNRIDIIVTKVKP